MVWVKYPIVPRRSTTFEVGSSFDLSVWKSNNTILSSRGRSHRLRTCRHRHISTSKRLVVTCSPLQFSTTNYSTSSAFKGLCWIAEGSCSCVSAGIVWMISSLDCLIWNWINPAGQLCWYFEDVSNLAGILFNHSQIYNYFNYERHLENRQTYKQKRITALIEWYQICFIDLCDCGALRRVGLCLTTLISLNAP